MDQENIDAIYNLLDKITLTVENEAIIEEIRQDLNNENYPQALVKLKNLTNSAEPKNVKKNSLTNDNPDL